MTERLEHFREWVEAHQMLTGAIVVAVFLCVYLLSVRLRQPADAWLNVAFINEYRNVGSGSEIYEDFMSLEVPQGQRVVFDTDYFFDLSNDRDFANQYYQKLVAYLESGTTDAVVCTQDNLRGIAQGGRVLDLTDERASGIYSDYSDRLYYYEDDEAGRLPVGISLSGSPYEDELGYKEEIYLALSSRATHISQVEKLLNFLLSEGGKK